MTDVVVVEAVLLGNASSLHCHRDGNRMSELSLISGSFCHCQKLDEVISIDSEVGILDVVVVVVVLVDVVEDFLIIVVVNFGVTIADVVVNIVVVVEEEVEVVLVIVLVVVLVETFAVEVIVVDVEVVEAVVLAAVDKVVRIADDVETFWLLSLGVGELFGMLITLVMLGDSDQELETLLLACHIPCYVYLFYKTLNLSNKENNPCRDNKLIQS